MLMASVLLVFTFGLLGVNIHRYTGTQHVKDLSSLHLYVYIVDAKIVDHA